MGGLAGRREPGSDLTFDEQRTVSALVLQTREGFPASRPREVVIEGGGTARRAEVDDDGRLEFAPVTGQRLTLRFPDPDPVYSTNPAAGSALEILPVGIAEADTVPRLPRADPALLTEWTASCAGPAVSIDGTSVTTSLSGLVGDLAQRRPMQLQACGALPAVDAGVHRIRSTVGGGFQVDSLALSDLAQPITTAEERTVLVRSWAATRRTVDVRAGDPSLLVVAENYNPGWVASLGGRELRAVRVDGWQQGWQLLAL